MTCLCGLFVYDYCHVRVTKHDPNHNKLNMTIILLQDYYNVLYIIFVVIKDIFTMGEL